MSSIGAAKAIRKRFESNIRDLHRGGETVDSDDLIRVIATTFEDIKHYVPEAEPSLHQAMSKVVLCGNVMDQVETIRQRAGKHEEVVETLLQLDEPHLRRAVERSTNHKGDTLLRTSLVELEFNLNRVIERIVVNDSTRLSDVLDHSKARVLDLMHGSFQQTRKALKNHGGLYLRDAIAGVACSHTVKYMGATDPDAGRIRGHVRWDQVGRPVFESQLFSIQASDHLSEAELRRAASILLYKFGLHAQDGHCVFISSRRLRLRRQTAHVTVWSVYEKIGRRFEVLVYPRKHTELLNANIA